MVSTLAGSPYFRRAGLILSVSGGLDSMVMLDLFHGMRHVHQSPLRVFHVHHGTGAFADLSLELVEREAGLRNLPVIIRRFSWDGKENFEFAASVFRREALKSCLNPGEIGVVAHHAGDQVETFFQALGRGVDVAARLGMCVDDGMRVRPFLHLERHMLLEHAADRGVPHLLDPSNRDTARFRNAIRHSVMPVLERFHRGFSSHVHQHVTYWHRCMQMMETEAGSRVERFQSGAFLSADAFQPGREPLWPWILKCFLASLGELVPHRNQAAILDFLEQGKTGRVAVNQGFLYCDEDGLALLPSLPPGPLVFGRDQVLTWGALQFRLEIQTECASNQGADHHWQLRRPPALHRRVREAFRRGRLPMRIRYLLPEIRLHNRWLHWLFVLHFVRNGSLKLTQIKGQACCDLRDLQDLRPDPQELLPAF